MAKRYRHTPEALLGRNDSRNPTTTCKGITNSGRPCRRPLATMKLSSSRGFGAAAAVEQDEMEEAKLYCWQHKVQASTNGTRANNRPELDGRKSKPLKPLKERSSIDTFVQRLGIETDPQGVGTTRADRKSRERAPAQQPSKRVETKDFAATRQSNVPRLGEGRYSEKLPRPQDKPPNKKPSFWRALCCMVSDDEDRIEIVRHRKRVEQESYVQEPYTQPATDREPSGGPKRSSMSHHRPVSTPAATLGLQQSSPLNPHTAKLISRLPAHLSSTTNPALFAELVKPTYADDAKGYIYIFWLTPQEKAAPAEDTAQSLLSNPNTRPQHARRISDVMTEYSCSDSIDEPRHLIGTKNTETKKKTIMLKVGRANNVTRRMNEWHRQCGFAPTLVRWYPYVPSSTSASTHPHTYRRESDNNGTPIHKVPMVRRVERFIHLELAEQQVKRQCAACGREHREWFEVEASREGVRRVDECVKRWVRWAEEQAPNDFHG